MSVKVPDHVLEVIAMPFKLVAGSLRSFHRHVFEISSWNLVDNVQHVAQPNPGHLHQCVSLLQGELLQPQEQLLVSGGLQGIGGQVELPLRELGEVHEALCHSLHSVLHCSEERIVLEGLQHVGGYLHDLIHGHVAWQHVDRNLRELRGGSRGPRHELVGLVRLCQSLGDVALLLACQRLADGRVRLHVLLEKRRLIGHAALLRCCQHHADASNAQDTACQRDAHGSCCDELDTVSVQ
mmetsp:Transcript_64489/g.199938  ORF Transcript_64489/g.199938 Transcript_64489/m.199938 type:complete len:238 (+) Transcript_64489:328-1041(+)